MLHEEYCTDSYLLFIFLFKLKIGIDIDNLILHIVYTLWSNGTYSNLNFSYKILNRKFIFLLDI